MTAPKWTAAEVAALLRMRNAGAGVTAIAKALGRTNRAVYHQIDRIGTVKRRYSRKGFARADAAHLAALRTTGQAY